MNCSRSCTRWAVVVGVGSLRRRWVREFCPCLHAPACHPGALISCRLPALPARATCAVLPLAPLPLQEPDNLDLIQDRHLRMQARACINHAVDEEYLKAWAHCTAGGRAAPPPRPLLNVRACRPLCSRPNPCT
jgi:hypothetical protein